MDRYIGHESRDGRWYLVSKRTTKRVAGASFRTPVQAQAFMLLRQKLGSPECRGGFHISWRPKSDAGREAVESLRLK